MELNFNMHTIASSIGHQNTKSRNKSGMVMTRSRSMALIAAVNASKLRKISSETKERGTNNAMVLIATLVGIKSRPLYKDSIKLF